MTFLLPKKCLVILCTMYLLSLVQQAYACGYDYIGSCATFIDLSINGNPQKFHIANCNYADDLNNYALGQVNSLKITDITQRTWESCTNDILNAKLHYRVYQQGATPGTFTFIELTETQVITTGNYEARAHAYQGEVDLIQGLPEGSYVFEFFFNSDVDVDEDGTPDLTLSRNNNNTNYRTSFSIKNLGGETFTAALKDINSITCNGDGNGAISLDVRGGFPPYDYLWSNGENAPVLTNLEAGIYRVTVSDKGNNSQVLSTQIFEPSVLNLQYSTDNESAPNTNDGSINVVVTGGRLPYTYQWSTGDTRTGIDNLSGGIYQLTVTDANNCTVVDVISIDTDGGVNTNLQLEIAGNTNPICSDGNDGQATVSPLDGVGPYTYLWSNGQTGATARNLSQGLYFVTVTDVNRARGITFVEIEAPDAIEINTSVTPASNNTSSDGRIATNISGGTRPYSYQWSNGVTAASLNNIAAGTYTLTVTDANNCETISTIDVVAGDNPVGQITAVIASKNDVSCNGGLNGSATVNVSDGRSPYQYRWSNGQITARATNLTAGIYTVSVTDADGATGIASVEIEEPTLLTVGIDKTNTTFLNSSNGSATAIVSGGTAPYQYNWSIAARTATISNLGIGTYNLTVTDAQACINLQLVTINSINDVQETIEVNIADIDNVSCFGENDGQASVDVLSGTAPYTYLWSDGQTTARAINLAAQAYSVTVTDANNARGIINVVIEQPNQLNVSTNKTTYTTEESIQANVNGGSAPYSYQWSTGATGAVVGNLTAGDYSLTVTDSNNCTATLAVVVEQAAITPPLQLILSNTQAISCFGASDGAASVTVLGGIAPYQYLWSNGATTAEISDLVAGTYTLTVTDSENTNKVAAIAIRQPSALTLQLTPTSESQSGAKDGQVTSLVTGGTRPYTYLWNTGATSSSISGLIADTYSVMVQDVNNCTTSETVEVEQDKDTNPTTPTPDSYCESASVAFWHDWIAKVNLGTINKISSKNTYSDFTNVATTLREGETYTITLTTGYSWDTYDTYWRVWIDYNRDGIFDETTELAAQKILPAPASGTPIASTTATIKVPTTVNIGTTRMRVAMQSGAYPASPCANLITGEVEDYHIILNQNIDTPNQCSLTATYVDNNCDDNGTADNATDDTYGFKLLVERPDATASDRWTALMGNRLITGEYGINKAISGLKIGDGSPLEIIVQDAIDATCSQVVMITPPSACSDAIPLDYCDAQSNIYWFEWIAGVQVGTIDNPSNRNAYSNYKHLETNLEVGKDYPITMTTGYSWITADEYWSVWIDYNQDGTFSTSEIVAQGITTAPSDGNISADWRGNLMIPTTALSGKTTMRIAMQRGSYPTACGNIGSGEVEDYTVNIINELSADEEAIAMDVVEEETEFSTTEVTTANNYCEIGGQPWTEWISVVQLEGMLRSSGKDYHSFNEDGFANLDRGKDYTINLTARYTFSTYDEYFGIWIDFNRNGVFEENEQVVDKLVAAPPTGIAIVSTQATIKVPNDAILGPTRMRVIMQRDVQPDPCTDVVNGEVEDYRVVIGEMSEITNITSRALPYLHIDGQQRLNAIQLDWSVNQVQDLQKVAIQHAEDGLHYETIFESEYIDQTILHDYMDDNPTIGSNYYRLLTYDDTDAVTVSNITQVNYLALANTKVYPNLTSDYFNINLSKLANEVVHITIYNSYGQVVYDELMNPIETPIEQVAVHNWVGGRYYVSIKATGYRTTTEVITVAKL